MIGLTKFKSDTIRQELFFVTGLYFEIREAKFLPMGTKTSLHKIERAYEIARKYYELSFNCPEIEVLDNKLFR